MSPHTQHPPPGPASFCISVPRPGLPPCPVYGPCASVSPRCCERAWGGRPCPAPAWGAAAARALFSDPSAKARPPAGRPGGRGHLHHAGGPSAARAPGLAEGGRGPAVRDQQASSVSRASRLELPGRGGRRSLRGPAGPLQPEAGAAGAHTLLFGDTPGNPGDSS